MLDPLARDAGLALLRGERVDLIEGRLGDEPAEDGAGNGGVAAARRVGEIEDQRCAGRTLGHRRVEGGDRRAVAERVVEADARGPARLGGDAHRRQLRSPDW